MIMEEKMQIKYKVKKGEDKEVYRAMREAAERLGFKWYGQGFDLTNGNRDMCFGRGK